MVYRDIKQRWGAAVPGRASLPNEIAERRFPQPVRISRDRLAWWDFELEAYFATLPRALPGWRGEPRRHDAAAKAKMRAAWVRRKAATADRGAHDAAPEHDLGLDRQSSRGGPSVGPVG
jgi:predicted DNA-binding transcriptional regulator AlpA